MVSAGTIPSSTARRRCSRWRAKACAPSRWCPPFRRRPFPITTRWSRDCARSITASWRTRCGIRSGRRPSRSPIAPPSRTAAGGRASRSGSAPSARGLVTASSFWPGSEAAIGGVRPTYWGRYDETVADEKRVDEVLGWLDLPVEKRPRLITLYFDEPDSRRPRLRPGLAAGRRRGGARRQHARPSARRCRGARPRRRGRLDRGLRSRHVGDRPRALDRPRGPRRISPASRSTTSRSSACSARSRGPRMRSCAG